MEKDLEDSIKRAKKLRFFIEKELYSKEANIKYKECKDAIMDDRSLSSKEKDKYLSDLDELFIFDL